MSLFVSRPSASNQGAGNRQQKDVSMERALRRLTPTKSPAPLTPRTSSSSLSPQRLSSGGLRKCGLNRSTTKLNGVGSKDRASGEEAVKVAIRIRPLAPTIGPQNENRAWKALAGKNSVTEIQSTKSDVVKFSTPSRRAMKNNDVEYTYDKVFGEETNTCQIYRELVGDIVDSVTQDGINGTVFTYGQTSSGKTFTMQGCGGSRDDSVGVIQLAAKDIFESIKEESNGSGGSRSTNSISSVRVSYLEVYNEELRDLLSDNNQKPSSALTIKENKQGSIVVENLKEVAVNSLEQLMKVFRDGEKNKSVGSTKMNERSSRSHAILQITVEKKTVLNARGAVDDKENAASPNAANNFVVKTSSTLNLVDLAGSESVRHTSSSGMQKKEGGMINQSLLTLSKVLMSLGQKKPGHINYRDSKLTRILKPSLSGNARMAVICCISPSGKFVEETRSTLQFASRAKLVKTKATANEVIEDDAGLITQLRLENANANTVNRKMEEKLRDMENKVKAMEEELHTNTSNRIMENQLREKDAQVDALQEELRVYKVATEKKKGHSKSMSTSILDIALNLDQVALSPALDRRLGSRSSPCDVDDLQKTENQELESKLANANKLIASLERQIDGLSSQKNDALDWIEELFAKAEQRDKKAKQAFEERNITLRKCELLESELASTKGVLECATKDLEQSRNENAKLRSEKEEAATRINSLESQIDTFQHEIDSEVESTGRAKMVESENEAATARIKSSMEAQIDSLQLQLDSKVIGIEALQSEKKEASTRIKSMEAQIDSLKYELHSTDNKSTAMIEALQAENKAASVRIKAMEAEIKSLNSDLHTAEESAVRIEALVAELKKEKEEHNNTHDTLDQVTAEKENLAELESQVRTLKTTLENEIQILKSEQAKLAGATRQNEQFSGDLDIQNKSLLRELEKERKVVSELRESNGELSKQIEDYSNKVQQAHKVVSEHITEKESLLGQIEKYDAELSKKKSYEDLMLEIEDYSRKFERAQNVIYEHAAEKKGLVAQIEQYEVELSRAETALKAHNSNYATNEEINSLHLKLGKAKNDQSSAQNALQRVSAENEELENEVRTLRIERNKLSESARNLVESSLFSDIESEKRVNEDLRRQVEELSSKVESYRGFAQEYSNEKSSLLDQIKQAEEELSRTQADLKSKSELLDDTIFSLEREKKKNSEEKTANIGGISHTRKLKSSVPSCQPVSYVPSTHTQSTTTGVNGMGLERVTRECDNLKSENVRLKAERRHLKDLLEQKEQKDDSKQNQEDFDLLCQKSEQLSTEYHLLHMQLEKANQRVVKIEAELVESERRKTDASKQLNARDKELSFVQRSNASLVKKDKEMQGAISRYQDLVHKLTSEISELKEKNDGIQRTNAYLENQARELEGLLLSATAERDTALGEQSRFRTCCRQLEETNEKLSEEFDIVSSERDSALYKTEKIRLKIDKMAADFHSDYEVVQSEMDILRNEKRELESELLILNAGKASVEDNADRILERDNALNGKYERLKVEYKKQAMMCASFQDEVNRLARRIRHMQVENDRLSRENRSMAETVMSMENKVSDDANVRRRVIFGFRASR